MDETGCDFIMVGRAALGNPWIFDELIAAQEGSALPGKPNNYELADAIIEQFKSMEEKKGEYIAVREMRKFVPKYLRGIKGSSAIRGLVNNIETGRELCELIEENLKRNGH